VRGPDGPGQPCVDSDRDSLVGIHSEGIVFDYMKDYLIIFIFLMIAFLMIMQFNQINRMQEQINEWRHVIDFLKLWIEQNDLQITPPTQTT
jgi:hypothetical protein